MSKLEFRRMNEEEKIEHNCSEKYQGFVATNDKRTAYIVLLPFIDELGQINSYMKMKMRRDDEKSSYWFTTRKAQVHKAVNEYMVKSAQAVIVCDE